MSAARAESLLEYTIRLWLKFVPSSSALFHVWAKQVVGEPFSSRNVCEVWQRGMRVCEPTTAASVVQVCVGADHCSTRCPGVWADQCSTRCPGVRAD